VFLLSISSCEQYRRISSGLTDRSELDSGDRRGKSIRRWEYFRGPPGINHHRKGVSFLSFVSAEGGHPMVECIQPRQRTDSNRTCVRPFRGRSVYNQLLKEHEYEERTKTAVCRSLESATRRSDVESGRTESVPAAGCWSPGRFPVVRGSRRR